MEDGGGWAVLLQQCHPNSAGSLIIAGGTEWGPHCFVVLLCCRLPPKLGKRQRYIDIDRCEIGKKKNLKIHFRVDKTPSFSFPLHYLRKEVATVFDGVCLFVLLPTTLCKKL